MTPDQFVAAARDLIGTPFHHQGRAPGVGLDCAGLVVCAARACGEAVVDATAYGREPWRGMLAAVLAANPGLEALDGAAPQAGDVLLMRFAREPQHLAICAGETVLHAYEAVGRVVEHVLDDAWRRRIVRIYRWRAS